MTTDKKNPDWLFNDRDGAGKTISRKLVDHIGGDTEGFRTVIVKDGDRGDTMLRTKGGKKEVTMQEVKPEQLCIKGPLIEIAFKYVVSTAESGYRRWYGEPDPNPPSGAPPEPAEEAKYVYSSDLLFSMESRKIQKICCNDGNGNKVDFLFAKRPEGETDTETPVSASAARSRARFKFTEGLYSKREWYKTELADIGWAFSGPTIKGDPTPEPASAVKFFIRRLRSIVFTVTDTLKKVKSSGVKWVFLNAAEPARSLGAVTETCANQNAREVSFSGRTFFTPNTDGNMERITMSVGIDQPPAVSGGPSFTVRFKKPGSFISAIDPEEATGNARPAEVEKAIDLMDFSSFGNPYHGFYWEPDGSAAAIYTDSSRSTSLGFTPVKYLPGGFVGGDPLTHKYYNVTGKDPLLPENQIKTDSSSDGVLYPDAFLMHGAWYVKDADYIGWGQLQYFEFLYKDPAGTVWVMGYEVTDVSRAYSSDAGTGVDHAIVTVRVKLLRRFGVLGTEFSGVVAGTNDIDRTIATLTFVDKGAWIIGGGFVMYLFRQYAFFCHQNAKDVMCQCRYMADGESRYQLQTTAVLSMSGTGAKAASTGVLVGDGISVSVSTVHDYSGRNYTHFAGSITSKVYVLDDYYGSGKWNVIEGREVSVDQGGGFYDRKASIFRNGTEVAYVQQLVTNADPYEIRPVFPYTAQQTVPVSELSTPYFKPLAWTIIRPGDASSFSTKLVYRDSEITVDQADFQFYTHTDTLTYSAKLGWAYNYRTKELVTVPVKTIAYFI